MNTVHFQSQETDVHTMLLTELQNLFRFYQFFHALAFVLSSDMQHDKSFVIRTIPYNHHQNQDTDFHQGRENL